MKFHIIMQTIYINKKVILRKQRKQWHNFNWRMYIISVLFSLQSHKVVCQVEDMK